jgi:integrase
VREKAPRTILDRDQLKKLLLDARLPAMVKVMITVATCTVLRASEILGLHWDDVDFENGTIRVVTSVVGKSEDVPKTPRSKAEVPMHPDLARALHVWKGHTPVLNSCVWESIHRETLLA